jgi:hypothetical protein
MYLAKDLKQIRYATDDEVPCPVESCSKKVKRRMSNKGGFENMDYFCENCGIYVTPTTFVQKNWEDNILWNDDLDKLRLLKEKKTEGRRFGHEVSEDAVTWNIFRYMEKNQRLGRYISKLTGTPAKNLELFYWGIDGCGNCWEPLAKARNAFEPHNQKKHRTEPDLIVKTDSSLLFFESKVGSGNDSKDISDETYRRYMAAGNHWSKEVFTHKLDQESFGKHYQLARHWLLGSWIAEKCLDVSRFYLVNLVAERRERGIVDWFRVYSIGGDKRAFERGTWEDVYRFLAQNNGDELVLSYMEGKTLGYSGKYEQRLQYAFNLPSK